MSGTKAGGLKAAVTNMERHGEDFYKRIGAQGGAAGNTGGFAANRELARTAGAKGGRISRRGKALPKRTTINGVIRHKDGDWMEKLVPDPTRPGHYVCTPF